MERLTPSAIFIPIRDISRESYSVWIQEREDFWEFPGGKIHVGESPEDAVRREVKEEVGVYIKNPQLFKILPFQYPDKLIYLYIFVGNEDQDFPVGRSQEWSSISYVENSTKYNFKTWEANKIILEDLSAYFIEQNVEGNLDLLWN